MVRFGRDTWLFFRKELLHLSKDRRSQLLTLALPVVATISFGLAFAGQNFQAGDQPEPYPMAVKDLDRSGASQEFVVVLGRTGLFELHILAPEVDAAEYMNESAVFGALILPQGFGAKFQAGHPEFTFVQDSTRPYVGYLTVTRVKLVLEGLALQQGRGAAFNYEDLAETGGSLDVFTPGIVILLIAFTSLNDISTSLVRERNEGTLGRVFLSPTTKAAFVTGKLGAGLVLVVFRSLLILAVVIAGLGFTMRGDLASYLALVLLAGLVTLGIGILLAARARTEREVMIATLMVTIVLMFMMGAITPLDLMSGPARRVALAIPHTYANESLRRVMLLGYPLFEELATVVGLLVVGVALTVLGAIFFRRQID